ncbi:hypothetical protein EJ04DRAFT_507840 [Polyplosphaeria fusca]|uniref:DUF4045 domain-containing protein n=1 Tax=Polyplosphaeria fusca TaxID=682080 RepID=A0A9P4V8Q4_9PLEO|nr:hypothetical protein EJ04DRAFT_507840 [Polyplosphaeria fusca]
MSEELDPSDFVARIRQLGEQRDQQDAERVRKLEEDIIQGRSERLARRAERARSLSPDKPTTPQSQSQSLRSPTDTPRSIQEKAAGTPTPSMDPRDASLQRLTGSPAQQLDDDEPKKPAPNAAALGRSGTLSWQRRPQSGSIRRPLSAHASSADAKSTSSPQHSPEPSSPAEAPLSRNQIATSLGAKHPSWFKQTPDRGIGSAAYRRSQEDGAPTTGSQSGRKQLPGMSRDSAAEPEATSPPPESLRSSSPSHTSSVRGSVAWSNRFSANTSVSGGDTESIGKTKSPLPVLDSQKFAPPSDQDADDQTTQVRTLAMSPTQGRISPERTDRPPSPTKGMGGFVQSAMMKRSDSFNKRWSSQTPPGLSRGNSTTSNRGSSTLSGHSTLPKSDSRPSSLSREASMEPSSRPGSSSSNLTITKDTHEKESRGEFVKPALPHHSRSKSVASTFRDDNNSQEETSPPSPSKRWSPTKSSWLENALNKPESPKPKQPPPQQPSWMAELSRAKQQRESVDLGKSSPLHSPPAPGTASGRTSPIKDVQLKPVALRRTESPTKEKVDTDDLERPAMATKPIPSPKPTVVIQKTPAAVEDTTSSEIEQAPTTTDQSEPISKPTPTARESVASPPVKPKPETPPKKDFRAGLRSRQTASESSQNNQQSELQSVFGRLKKTETKNYVAPDTLKDNILRGKTALTVTGGPKPSVRRDEFKESIISKKSAMLAKAQEQGSALKRADSSSQSTATPEALAKRNMLGRRDSESKDGPLPKEGTVPEALSRQQSLRTNKPIVPEKQQVTAGASFNEGLKPSKLADRFNPGLAGLLARGPPSAQKSEPSSSSEPPSKSSIETKEGSALGLTHMTKGRARGPKRRAPATKDITKSEATETPTKIAPVAAIPLVKAENVLSSNVSARTNAVSEDQSMTRTPARDPFKAKPATPAKSPEISRKLEKSPVPEPLKKSSSLELEKRISSSSDVPAVKPVMDESRAPQQSSSSPKIASWKSSRPLPTPPSKPMLDTQAGDSQPKRASPSAEVPTTEAPSPEKASFSVKDATSLWGKQSASPSFTPSKPKSPIRLPTRADEEIEKENAGLVQEKQQSPEGERGPQAPKPKPIGLGLGSFGGFGRAGSRESSPAKPPSAKAFPASPPASADRPQSEPFKATPAPEKSEGLFADFFDEAPVTTGNLPENIDTVQILRNPPLQLEPGAKIRTLRKQIQEITGDGKLISVPMHEEHVLFQDSMYLCTHIFGDSNGAKTTEVYLWSGNGVAESTLEDAQLFARNAAKQSQGRLINLRQGKESPNFFEALGGIVITRRGSHPAPKEYMLCGRRHLGHITFDEVEFSLKSLCSAFAYLISTNDGLVFLWKGRGCSAEELSGARLMGMDLTPSGELHEIDEGAEPEALFKAFPPSEGKGPAIPRSASHWSHKANSDKYRTRLFKIEQQQGSSGWGQGLQVSSFFAPLLRRPSWQSFSSSGERPTERPQTPSTPKSSLPPITTKAIEIMPYCQRDLEPEYIFVLDAFFEMYIIVGALSRTQSVAFSTALEFAQEYSILAVSEEDRPFMPVTTIVLEGVPRDMKAVFRFWDDALIPAAGLMRGKLGRGKSLRIVGLEKAIEATRR